MKYNFIKEGSLRINLPSVSQYNCTFCYRCLYYCTYKALSRWWLFSHYRSTASLYLLRLYGVILKEECAIIYKLSPPASSAMIDKIDLFHSLIPITNINRTSSIILTISIIHKLNGIISLPFKKEWALIYIFSYFISTLVLINSISISTVMHMLCTWCVLPSSKLLIWLIWYEWYH